MHGPMNVKFVSKELQGQSLQGLLEKVDEDITKI